MNNVAGDALDGAPVAVPASALFRPIALAALEGRDTIYRAVAVALALTIGISLALPRSFTATGEFVPQSGRSQSNLTGIAAQLGVNLQQGDLGQTPAFYAALLDADELLGWVADDTVPRAAGGTAPRMVADVLGATSDDPNKRRDEAVREIRRRMISSDDQKTGIVSFSIWARNPSDAAGLGSAIVRAVDRFNVESRHTQASAERRSSEQQLVETGKELRNAEDRLEQFLQTNREYRSSPDLAFAEDRLARDVTLRQQVFATVSSAYEQAKIDEARDTPAIAVVNHPAPPARADSRHLLFRAIAAGLLALVFGAALVYFRKFGYATAAQVVEADADITIAQAIELLAVDFRNPRTTVRRLLPKQRAR